MEGTSTGFAGPDPRLMKWLKTKAIDHQLHRTHSPSPPVQRRAPKASRRNSVAIQ
jgi:hypothetical protein